MQKVSLHRFFSLILGFGFSVVLLGGFRGVVFADATTIDRQYAAFTECSLTTVKAEVVFQDTCSSLVTGISACLAPSDPRVAYGFTVKDGVLTVGSGGGVINVLQPTLGLINLIPRDTPPIDIDLSGSLTAGHTLTLTVDWYAVPLSLTSDKGRLTSSCVVGQFIAGGKLNYSGPTFSFTQILQTINGLITPIGLLFGIFMTIKAGYTLMTSEGEPSKVKEAKDDLTAAITGTIFILLSVVILKVIISSILGG